MLLVLGAAMLAGGVRYSEQHFNPVGARSEATMLTLAAIALIVPAAFEAAADMTAEGLGRLSVSLSVVLLLTYVLFLTFALVTHPALFAGSAAKEEKAPASGAWSMLVLGAAMLAGGLRHPGRRAFRGDDADACGDRIDSTRSL